MIVPTVPRQAALPGAPRLAARRVGNLRAVAVLVMVVAASGCAHRPQGGVPIDQRPTPAQPGPATGAPSPTPEPAPTTRPTTPAPEGDAARAAADTLAARRAVSRCAGRKLLPEQESTLESVTGLLRNARTAMLRGDFVRAESLARQARQLSGSLGCP